MPSIVRFAPSPTGFIHVGNARTALFNWLFALRDGGRFLLRFDDTDAKRSRSDLAAAIAADLAWLGIAPAAIYRQSDRLALYAAAAGRLEAAGRLYACYETAEELEARRQSQRRRGLPPVYDRAGLRLTAARRADLEAEGRRPHWRFLLGSPEAAHASGEIAWDDLFRGRQAIDLGSLSDPVLVREDGTFPYTMPSVADDIDMGTTHVIRGEDHVTNTAVQIELFRALGAAEPAFGHHNLLVNAEGEGLSKRMGSQSVASYREAGFEPMAVASLAVLIGTSEAVEPAPDLETLARRFTPSKVSRAPARFDDAELAAVNARLLQVLPWEAVAPRLAALGVGGGEAFWNAVRKNCTVLADARLWWDVVSATVAPVTEMPREDAAFVAGAADALPPEPWDGATWSNWIASLKEASGRSGRRLFMPLRLALTGRDHGPELAALLPFIGRSSTLARLAGYRPR
ncbi:MAG: glutamate--tRNA ligase [Bauldia sp.]|nr:glutamate--tRNA ligase [Bauldia sp.]